MDEAFHPFERAVEDWHWWYSVRRDILDQFLARLPLDPARAELLDVGCGTGGSSLVMSRYGRVTGLDCSINSFRLSMDRPYAHRVVARAEVLPFRDGAFDAVAALDVLEHLDDDVAGARELGRVLKPGGSVVIFVPAFQFLWGYNDEFSHHRRRYTRPQLVRVLEEAGLTVDDSGYFNLLLFLPMLTARLAERVSKDAVAKVEYNKQPSLLNSALLRIFRMELPLLRRAGLPLGASVFAVARRQ